MGKFINRLGEIHISNEGYSMKITKYDGKMNCQVTFDDTRNTILSGLSYQHIKSGSIKNPFHPSVFGVGCIGIGKYKAHTGRKPNKNYEKWQSILERTNCPKYKEKFPTYKDVMVCDEWKCFQNFAKWHEENWKPYMDNSWDLDKDIKVRGNKIYSPKTCSFVPKSINYVFVKKVIKNKQLPTGVVYNTRNNCFMVNISLEGKPKSFSPYITLEEAFEKYKFEKEKYIKRLADQWRDKIEPLVYQSMYNWKILINE